MSSFTTVLHCKEFSRLCSVRDGPSSRLPDSENTYQDFGFWSVNYSQKPSEQKYILTKNIWCQQKPELHYNTYGTRNEQNYAADMFRSNPTKTDPIASTASGWNGEWISLLNIWEVQ